MHRILDDGANASDLGFYFVVLPGLLLPLVYFHLAALKKGDRLADIRRRWGRPRRAHVGLKSIAFYHDLRAATRPSGRIDDQTWSDLDLDAVFRQLDHTCSAVGQQVLYDILRTPQETSEALSEKDRLVQSFAEQPGLRTAVQAALLRLDTRNTFDLPRLFLQDLPEIPRFYGAIPAGTLLTLAALAALFHTTGLGVLVLLFFIAGNIALGLVWRRRYSDFSVALRSLHCLLGAGERLARLGSPAIAGQTAPLGLYCRRLRRLKKISAYLVFDDHFNEVLASAYAYLNTFLLLDLNVFLASVKMLQRHKKDIRAVYESVGRLDALVAIASYRHSLPFYCRPQFTAPAPQLSVGQVYHPLLQDPVANSVAMEGKSLLLYGANMSGKTTFIRSLGLSAILGQTIYTCPARSYRAPFLHVQSFINRKDDILGGRSYFLAEVESVHELVKACDGAAPCLFLVDELFKGTSPQECTALSQAVLDYLHASGHLVAAASHDAVLQRLLPEWAFFHFGQIMDEGVWRFDYRLRRGPGRTYNAVGLLAAKGYPAAVIRAAEKNLSAFGQYDGSFTEDDL